MWQRKLLWKRRKKNKFVGVVCGLNMSVGSLDSFFFRLSSERRKSVCEIEKVSAKVTRLKCSLLFNSTCLKENKTFIPGGAPLRVFHRMSHHGRHGRQRVHPSSVLRTQTTTHMHQRSSLQPLSVQLYRLFCRSSCHLLQRHCSTSYC